MARKVYPGFTLAELRSWARLLDVKGRSRMGRDELSAACDAAYEARLRAAEQQILRSGVVFGSHFRVQCGCVIVSTAPPRLAEVEGKPPRYFTFGEYVELCVAHGSETGHNISRLIMRYRNRLARGEAGNEAHKFFLWSIERVQRRGPGNDSGHR